MFTMNSVGAKISELRKKHNVTQMEPADKMNIRFQAVSNWERGNSMPDIGKLPELAQKRYALQGIKNLTSFVPFLSQELLKKIARKEFDTHGVEGLPLLAPFLDKDTLEAFAQESIKTHGLQSVLPIVPFLGQESLTEYIRKQFL